MSGARMLTALLGTGLLLCATPASAGVVCTGTVSRVIIGPDGDTYVDFGYNRVKVCVADASLTVNRGVNSGGQVTITPGRCSALISAFLTAKASGKPVTVDTNKLYATLASWLGHARPARVAPPVREGGIPGVETIESALGLRQVAGNMAL